jgi:hypothetical protein
MPGTRLKSRDFMVQLDSLNELFSNASVTDRNLLAETHHNKNSVISRILSLKLSLVFGEVGQK